MTKPLLLLLLLPALAPAAPSTPISRGRLATDLDGAGHSITNSPMATTNFVWEAVASVTNGVPSGGGAPVVRVNMWDPAAGRWASTNAVLQSSANIEYQVYYTSEDGHPVVVPVANLDALTIAMSVDFVRLVHDLPPVSASATVGELVDSINAVINAIRKEGE